MNNTIEKELTETGVLVLRLNRPEVLNAMNRDLIVGLLNTINETIDDEKVRSIVLTLSLIHTPSPRDATLSRMPSSA